MQHAHFTRERTSEKRRTDEKRRWQSKRNGSIDFNVWCGYLIPGDWFIYLKMKKTEFGDNAECRTPAQCLSLRCCEATVFYCLKIWVIVVSALQKYEAFAVAGQLARYWCKLLFIWISHSFSDEWKVYATIGRVMKLAHTRALAKPTGVWRNRHCRFGREFPWKWDPKYS